MVSLSIILLGCLIASVIIWYVSFIIRKLTARRNDNYESSLFSPETLFALGRYRVSLDNLGCPNISYTQSEDGRTFLFEDDRIGLMLSVNDVGTEAERVFIGGVIGSTISGTYRDIRISVDNGNNIVVSVSNNSREIVRYHVQRSVYNV